MSGITQFLGEPSSLSPLIGILYAEDFDDAAILAADARRLEATDAPPPPLTQDDVERACETAVAAARLQWQTEAEHLHTTLLESICTALTSAQDTAEQIANSAAEEAARTVLAMLSGALPQFCIEHGPAEVRAIVDRLLPLLRSEPRVVVRVHPELVPGLRATLADREADFSGTVSVLPSAIEPGDVKVEWENGSLSRDTRQILQAMQDALGQLGLQQPRETTSKRKLAHAE